MDQINFLGSIVMFALMSAGAIRHFFTKRNKGELRGSMSWWEYMTATGTGKSAVAGGSMFALIAAASYTGLSGSFDPVAMIKAYEIGNINAVGTYFVLMITAYQSGWHLDSQFNGAGEGRI